MVRDRSLRASTHPCDGDGRHAGSGLNIDEERGQFELDYRYRIASAQSLLNAAKTSEIDWLEDIPKLTADRESFDNGQYMAGLSYHDLEKALWEDVKKEFDKATVKHFGEEHIAMYKGNKR